MINIDYMTSPYEHILQNLDYLYDKYFKKVTHKYFLKMFGKLYQFPQ